MILDKLSLLYFLCVCVCFTCWMKKRGHLLNKGEQLRAA